VDSVSGVVLGVGALTTAWVTARVLFDLLFTLSTAFKLERDDRFSVGNRIWMSFSSSCSSLRLLVLCNTKNHIHVCYVIWENPAYRGTKMQGSDQTPRFLRGV